MNIWIVNPYGTLPREGWREYRSAQLARALAKRKHRVTWWLSNFEHRSKTYRSNQLTKMGLPDGVNVVLVDAPAYQKNISFGRIFYEIKFGENFYHLAKEYPPPDLIVLAHPPLFSDKPVVKYAKERQIKLVVDVFDLWPELFSVVIPKPIRKLGVFLFSPLRSRRDKLISNADGVVALTADYFDVVMKDLTKNEKKTLTVYVGVDIKKFDQDAKKKTSSLFPKKWVNSTGPMTIICAGTLGDAYDLPTVAQAMRDLIQSDINVRLLVAGDGPKKNIFELLEKEFPDHVAYIGSVDAKHLPSLYRKCDIGLCSYAKGSTVYMPTKFYDYLAAGVAILNSLDGEIKRLVSKGAGKNYSAGSATSLAEAITTFVKDKKLLAKSKKFSFKLREKFDSVREYEKYSKFIETIFNDGSN